MVGACGLYRGVERCAQGFGGKILDKETVWKIEAYMGK
jgi:hypothetical protein